MEHTPVNAPTEKHVSHDAGTAEDHPHAPYMLIFVVLLVLTLAEVGYSMAFQSSLPKALYIIGLLAMALWKALLVALYFMHLRFEPKRLWVLCVAPLPLIFILILSVMMEGSPFGVR
jgi:cytochrome c oxidase subunit IV